MIKINLIEAKKQRAQISSSVDFSQVNKKMLLISFLVYLITSYVTPLVWQWKINEANSEIATLDRQLASIKESTGQNKDARESLQEYKDKIPELEKLSTTVDELTSTAINPLKILEMIAKNTPSDLWFTMLEINKDRHFNINGLASSYKSIGDFMGRVNDTPFFSQSLNLADSKTLTQQHGSETIRLEEFFIEGSIRTYDPFEE